VNTLDVPSFDHYPIISGQGFANISAYHGRGGGWFSKLVAHGTNALKSAGAAAASAGMQHLASGGDLRGAAMAALSGARADGMSSVQRALTSGGGGYRKRAKRHPF